METRLNEINRLKAKYGNSIAEILAYCEEKEERLLKLQDYDCYLGELRKKLEQSEQEVRKYAEKLSVLRKEEAEKLTGLIQEGLQDLNFLDIQFEIDVYKRQGVYV